MLIVFVGGPWDGVKFEATYAPSAVGMRHLDVAFAPTDDPMTYTMSSSKRHHHQYLLDGRKLKEGVLLKVGETLPHEPEEGEDPLDLVSEDLLVMVYRYAPDKKLWWEK